MKKLQQIIDEMKRDIQDTSFEDNPTWRGCLEYYIPQLELLLNEQPEAITEDAQFCKHDVRRSAASDEGQVIGDSGAGSSETAAVRQNEQTKKDCHNCKYGDATGLWPCIDCARFDRWEAI